MTVIYAYIYALIMFSHISIIYAYILTIYAYIYAYINAYIYAYILTIYAYIPVYVKTGRNQSKFSLWAARGMVALLKLHGLILKAYAGVTY